jgi:pyruvate/2-oxoacid:ferredoxin oxidoreductase beta subunit
MIMAMHDIPYVATASPAYIPDLVRKVEEAMKVKDGLAYIHVYNPCVTGWGIRAEDSIAVARLAVKTRFFPLYEARNRRFRITVPVPNPRPIEEFTSRIKKFGHLGPERIAELAKLAEERYAFLESVCGKGANDA